MFELLGDDAMRYNGGLEQWKEEYVTNIHKRADALTVENMLEWSSTYYLKRAIINPWIRNITSIWTEADASPLPNNPLPSCNL